MPPASHQVSAASLKLLIQQIHLYARVEREFSEVSSAKWIFDVEIEKLRAESFLTCREDKNNAWLSPVSTYRAKRLYLG